MGRTVPVDCFIGLTALCLLLALLMVGVQKARTAAAWWSCSMNLQQLGFAMYSYHDVHNHLPPGTMPNPELPPEERFSFHVAICRYTECDNLYSLLDKQQPWDSERNVGIMAHRTHKVFQCPNWVDAHSYDANLVASGHLAFTNYVGVAGVGPDAATRPADAPGIGIFGYDRTLKLQDVKDGTENTAMLFETAHELGPWIRGGPSTVRAVNVDEAPLAGISRPFGGTHYRTSWNFGKRADGFNVLLADASVRFTSPDIDATILTALATIAGGEEIPPQW
jgi:Protein of unknown function (DUF1559)